eukprot:4916867-Amphidinium_carterae.1
MIAFLVPIPSGCNKQLPQTHTRCSCLRVHGKYSRDRNHYKEFSKDAEFTEQPLRSQLQFSTFSRLNYTLHVHQLSTITTTVAYENYNAPPVLEAIDQTLQRLLQLQLRQKLLQAIVQLSGII